MRALRKLRDIKHWFLYRFHPRHKYHLINTGLARTYWDYDERILHGCMAMLCEYVEDFGSESDIEEFNAYLRNPKNDPHAPGELKSGQADRQEEALAIYRWWKYQRPEEIKLRVEMCGNLFGRRPIPIPVTEQKQYHADFRALERKIEDDAQAMLHRLIDIRQSLWN